MEEPRIGIALRLGMKSLTSAEFTREITEREKPDCMSERGG